MKLSLVVNQIEGDDHSASSVTLAIILSAVEEISDESSEVCILLLPYPPLSSIEDLSLISFLS